MTNPLIYLASRSPRRCELLSQIGVAQEQLCVEVDETPVDGEAAEQYVIRMALEKARAGRDSLSVVDCPVLGADTAVVLDGEIFGKPRDQANACSMLMRLGGRVHQVMSAVALVDGVREASQLCVSHVSFREISESEARAYWQSGEPTDKAGGYGVQGIGALFVKHLEGSYSGVMGLPLFEAAALLRDFGVHPSFYDRGAG